MTGDLKKKEKKNHKSEVNDPIIQPSVKQVLNMLTVCL